MSVKIWAIPIYECSFGERNGNLYQEKIKEEKDDSQITVFKKTVECRDLKHKHWNPYSYSEPSSTTYLAVWPWASYITFLIFSFLICKLRIIIVLTSRSCCKHCYELIHLAQIKLPIIFIILNASNIMG